MKFELFAKDDVTLADKIVTVACKAIPVIGFLILQLSALQILKNDYQAAVKAAPFILNLLGELLVAGGCYWVYGMVTDKNWVSKSVHGNAGILLGLFGLGFLALMGF
jgi:hypothetical protein